MIRLEPFERYGALDRVLELPDVAGPVVNFQPPHGFRLDAIDLLVHGLRETIEKLARQQRNIFAAFAQRRQMDGNHAEAVIEVLAEPAFGNFLVEILVGGGDHANVDVASSVLPSGRTFPSCRTR